MDTKVKPMEETFKDIDIMMNDATSQENFPEIERANRTIKEMFRALYHQLPYKTTPTVMI